MELNNSVSMLYKFAVSGNMFQPKETEAAEKESERPDFRKVSFQGSRSLDRYMDDLSQRIEKMSSMLARLQQTVPVLNEASTVMVERGREGTSSFTYSLTQDQSGAITEEFTFKIQYKSAGESAYTEAGAIPTLVKSEPVSITPITDPVTEPVNIAPTSVETLAAPPTFDELIAQLIEYYRIGTVGAPVSAPAATPEGEEAGAGEHGNAEVKEHREGGDENEAGRVSRISMGAGDDTLSINADVVRRIRAGAGDDTLNINADKVARVRSGAGDDTVNIEADNVRRINTGAGDDVLNINADNVTRINTGEGDDTLSINADTITRVNTGAGDDTINLTANTIKRFDAGAGDDTITLDAEDAAIAFGKGGGEDTININSVGALAIQIDSALAASSEDMNIVVEGGSITLEFASGEKLTINNVENAGMISVSIGGENIDLHLGEAPAGLDMSA
jgi:hypothetical protein